MNRRQLKKADKKAMAILVGAYGYKPDSFGVDDDGWRVSFWWRCSFECDEWDAKHALDAWVDVRAMEHPNFERWHGFDPNTGSPIPEHDLPRPMGQKQARAFYRLAPPQGYRWRGKRVVKHARLR